MPELPEVETIKRALESGGRGGQSILGCQIVGADVLWDRTIQTPDVGTFKQRIQGQTIRDVSRRGKFLVIKLDTDTFLVHLRMSGDIRIDSFENHSESLQKHDRLVLKFANQTCFVFNNPRKFGRVWLVSDPQTILGKLGPEPFDPLLTAEVFYARIKQYKRQIKPLLMDQRFIAGLGNIYTDEALHLSGLHPKQLTNFLTFEQSQKLLKFIQSVLEAGIRRNGSSIDWVYRGGEFQNEFRVYGRTGEPCYQCGTAIQRIVIGQRGTHYCPECQKL